METTAVFNMSIVGEDTGLAFNGTFKVKTLLTRRDRFRADELRRTLIGANPETAAGAIVGDAIAISQLAVRIIDSPKWWTDSDSGQDLEDGNVIGEVFRLTIDASNKRKEALQEAAKEALKQIAESDSKKK